MLCVAQQRGAVVADLLAAVGLDSTQLDDPDARLPAPAVLSLWSALRERTGDPALQLAAPAALPWGAYRVIDYLVAASQTVGEGIDRFVRFFGLIANTVTLTIEESDGYAVRLAGTSGGAVVPVYVDYVFAALVTRIRMKVRPELEVHKVELRQHAPDNAAAYRALFRAPVHFGAAEDRLCFTPEEWQVPTRNPDTALALLLEEHARILAERVPSAHPDFRAQVQRTIAAAPAASGSAPAVARALHMSVRTLQRRLVDSGTTFRSVSDEVRRQLALGYLADPAVSIAEVAFLLGFSEQRSFNRAFRRWTGETAGRWRRKHL